MEERRLNVMFNKAGGTAGKGSYTTRMTIPKAWLDKMNVTKEDREVTVIFDEEKKEIIIKK